MHVISSQLRNLPMRRHEFDYLWTRTLPFRQVSLEKALGAILSTFGDFFGVIVWENCKWFCSKRTERVLEEIAKYVLR